MNYMKNKLLCRYGLSLLMWGGCLVTSLSHAQTRLLPILETPIDARAASLGGVSLMSTDRNHLYTNPSSIHNQEARCVVSATGVLFPKYANTEGRLRSGAISVGHKWADRHAVYAGFRYQGGLSYKISTGQFDAQEPLKYNPFDWVVDLGYAYKLSTKWSVFATGSFVQSYTSRPAYAGAFGVGANFLTEVRLLDRPSMLNIAARIADFGTPLYYSSTEKYLLPTKGELTVDVTTYLSEKQRLTAVVGGRSYFVPSNAPVYHANIGAEYTLYDLLSLRGGLQLGNKASSHWTCGTGLNFKWGKMDLAYLKGMNITHSDRLVLTLSYNY